MLNFNDTVKTVSGSMVVAACLVGCGGGSGSGDTSSPNAPKNMLTSTGTTTTTGGTGSTATTGGTGTTTTTGGTGSTATTGGTGTTATTGGTGTTATTGGTGTTTTTGGTGTTTTTGGTGSTNTTTNTPAVINRNLQRAEDATLAALNKHRQTCNFGKLTANSALNVSAANHADYLAWVTKSNYYPYSAHEEVAQTFTTGAVVKDTGITSPYYSGFKLEDRLNPKSMGGNAVPTRYAARLVGENLAMAAFATTDGTYVANAEKDAQARLTGLLAAPYHLRALVHPDFTEIGISYRQITWQQDKWHNDVSLLDLVSASPASQASYPNTQLRHYPCEGLTTAYQLDNEQPNPFGTTRDLEKYPIGQPIYVLAPEDKVIEKASAVITGNGESIAKIHLLTQQNDPNKTLAKNEVVFMPDKPLTPNTQYQASYQLTYASGETVTNRFSFTTEPKI